MTENSNHSPLLAAPTGSEKMMRLLYPPVCVFCGAVLRLDAALWVCASCQPAVEIAPGAWEPRTLSNAVTGCYAPFGYSGIIKQSIHCFKFENQPRFAQTFAWYMASGLMQIDPLPDFDMIIPVPMTKKREKDRGYNQSAWLAASLSEFLKVPVNDSVLVKELSKTAQHKLARKERLKNTTHQFYKNGTLPQHSCVLLVDDVLTTGSTISACADVLAAAGAKWIFTVCIAFA